ncbi:mCG145053, isoform CRA_b, partial [Mus musculus]
TLVAPTDRQRRLSPGTWQWEGEAGAGTQTSPLCPSHFRAPEQSQRSRRREAFQRTQRGVRLILIAEDTIHFRHRSQKLLSWIWTERFLPEEASSTATKNDRHLLFRRLDEGHFCVSDT